MFTEFILSKVVPDWDRIYRLVEWICMCLWMDGVKILLISLMHISTFLGIIHATEVVTGKETLIAILNFQMVDLKVFGWAFLIGVGLYISFGGKLLVVMVNGDLRSKIWMGVSNGVSWRCMEGRSENFKWWRDWLIGGSWNLSGHVGLTVHLSEHCSLHDLVDRKGLIFENGRCRSWSHNGKINREGLKVGISAKTHIKMDILKKSNKSINSSINHDFFISF